MPKDKVRQINLAPPSPKPRNPVAAQEDNTSRHQMPNGPRLTKDQQRAARAYEQVNALLRLKADDGETDDERRKAARQTCDEYQIAVKGLGANILRSGLSAAMADLMRRKDKARKLREHIADSQIPHMAIGGGRQAELFQVVNGLDVGQYMLATRETLEVVKWLKRATEALFVFPEDDKNDPEDQRHA